MSIVDGKLLMAVILFGLEIFWIENYCFLSTTLFILIQDVSPVWVSEIFLKYRDVNPYCAFRGSHDVSTVYPFFKILTVFSGSTMKKRPPLAKSLAARKKISENLPKKFGDDVC